MGATGITLDEAWRDQITKRKSLMDYGTQISSKQNLRRQITCYQVSWDDVVDERGDVLAIKEYSENGELNELGE